MEKIYKELLKSIGENTNREGLIKTPLRAANAMKYFTSGYRKNINDIINGAIFNTDDNEMIIVKNIEFYSLCEHHLVPFFGLCSVGYIPNGKVIGLSKIPRIVDMYSRRLQIQERLSNEIANALYKSVDAKGVIVKIEAKHLCMMMRGIEKQNSQTTTITKKGSIDDKEIEKFIELSQI